MLSIKLTIWAILFVVSSGAMFSKYFENHRVLRALAELMALISSYYALKAISDDLIGVSYQGVVSYGAIAISIFVYLYYISRSRVKNHADKPASAFGIAFMILLVFVSIVAYISYESGWIDLKQKNKISALESKGVFESTQNYNQKIADAKFIAGSATLEKFDPDTHIAKFTLKWSQELSEKIPNPPKDISISKEIPNQTVAEIFRDIGGSVEFFVTVQLVDKKLQIAKVYLPREIEITDDVGLALPNITNPSPNDTKPKENLDRQVDKSDYIKPALIHISAGSYTMGSNDGGSNEKPPHQVTIDYDFEIGKYEVSVEEFKKFVNDTNYKTDAHKGNGCYVYTNGSWDKKSDTNWKNAYITQDDKHPVVCVSWNDAQAYTKWLSQKTGDTYRLPTEAEWEYIARAGTTSKWSFGDDESQLTNYAWYTKNNDNQTHPVGTKNPNPWGLYDIHGNVWEWCEDWYTDNYQNTPRDGSANTKGKKGYRVLRGGSWSNYDDVSRSSNRSRFIPTFSGISVGFRLQRTLP